MAIYSFLCKCGHVTETHQSIGEYSNPATKRVPWHCEVPMERMLTVNGSNSAIAHALAGDRHYDGMVAPDGVTMLDTRSKHREYMKRNNLTIAEDYKGEWAGAQKQREARFKGTHHDNRAIIEREFTKAEQK